MKKSDSGLDFVEDGGIASPLGFRAAGVCAGLKKSEKDDLALVFSEHECNFAGTFTSNLFPAAPVQLCRDRVAAGGTIRAVVVNSGVANACTGLEGYKNAQKTAETVGAALHIAPEKVMVSSTGRIGVQLPMDKIAAGVAEAAKRLSPKGGSAAAAAIMTTDTRPKELAVSFLYEGKRVTIGGMTKGAGMISPKMIVARPHATMLCYLTTDAKISNELLADFLSEAVDSSFNRIVIDNDMSTNDTVIVLANGASGVKVANASDAEKFKSALKLAMQELARKMVMDGEGATKFVEIKVVNASSEAAARLCAEAVANSLLCKTAWFGCDPNWGRIVAALGYSGAEFDPGKVNVFYNEYPVVRDGGDAGTPESELAKVLKNREFRVTVELNNGDSDYWVWTSDISYEYVKINAEYHT